MEPQGINNISSLFSPPLTGSEKSAALPNDRSFRAILAKSLTPDATLRPTRTMPRTSAWQELPTASPPRLRNSAVANAYQQQLANAGREPGRPPSGWQKYKDDQLLSNPGGDQYSLEQKKILPEPEPSFFKRLGKDLGDAFDNVKNFFSNFLFGATVCRRDANDQIQTTKNKGFVGSIVDFCKDLGSALSFGTWRPDGEAAPQGPMARLAFFAGKIKEAVLGDLLGGIGSSINHMGEDLVLAGWNLVEVLPDATIGNMAAGRQLTSTIFDNGQVAIDYLTDILPFGEAWLRVHAPNLKSGDLPILYNLKLPENYPEDERWQNIRNTPFRKKIETVGALLADIVSLGLLGQITATSEKRH
ncbi:MAG: hypothetical protein A2521_10130 [Deltaproteobacteria bacterium RIFOXYD12_FULL_57_12]|nr:MAG: hypothetical protein A2521_10130 [Deltaproteobacteria bacterium RIFOXYD12_FULL_57_12]